MVLHLGLDDPRRNAEGFGNDDSVQGRSHNEFTVHDAIKAVTQSAARVEDVRDQPKGAMSAQILHVWHYGQLVSFIA